MTYWDTFVEGYRNYASYLLRELTFQAEPWWHNYVLVFLAPTLLFFVLEISRPWRKGQATIRKDFWLDAFYMVFNFFLFSLLIFNASSELVVRFMQESVLTLTGLDLKAINPLEQWPTWAVLIFGFVFMDFLQWCIHRLLHRVSWLWEFHKVHHSVREMGFAAHLRYHWMENVVYKSLQYLPLALLGIGLYDFFFIHLLSLSWGHYNHANTRLPDWLTGGIVGGFIGALIAGSPEYALATGTLLGIIAGSFVLGALLVRPFVKILFNSPEMHIWHHSKALPEEHPTGVNFGITLAVWDYVFGTSYIPHNGRDIELGFPGVDSYPNNFLQQLVQGFRRRK